MKMKSLRQALIYFDWCPYKKRMLRPRHTQKNDEDAGGRQSSTSQDERPQGEIIDDGTLILDC